MPRAMMRPVTGKAPSEPRPTSAVLPDVAKARIMNTSTKVASISLKKFTVR